jgi:hypothetical protein
MKIESYEPEKYTISVPIWLVVTLVFGIMCFCLATLIAVVFG